MKFLHLIFSIVFAFMLAACSSIDAPISNVAPTLASTLAPAGSELADDLIAAAANADGLVGIGVLAADDPIVVCSHGAVKAAGLDVAPAVAPKTFTPILKGELSKGVILYVKAKQAREALGQPFKVPTGCGDLLLQIRIDAVRDAAKLKALLPLPVK